MQIIYIWEIYIYNLILGYLAVKCGSFNFAFICLLIVVKCKKLDWCNSRVLVSELVNFYTIITNFTPLCFCT